MTLKLIKEILVFYVFLSKLPIVVQYHPYHKFIVTRVPLSILIQEKQGNAPTGTKAISNYNFFDNSIVGSGGIWTLDVFIRNTSSW